jgi:hypothetical protein
MEGDLQIDRVYFRQERKLKIKWQDEDTTALKIPELDSTPPTLATRLVSSSPVQFSPEAILPMICNLSHETVGSCLSPFKKVNCQLSLSKTIGVWRGMSKSV